jgi:hypothetical protein
MEPIEETNKFKKIFPLKVILLLLLIVLAIEGYFIVKSFKEPLVPPPPNVESITGGEILLVSSKEQLKIGENTRVAMKVSTGGHATQGTDIILRFDPKYMEASTSSIYKGGIYPDYPVISLDNTAGIVKISGLSPTTKKTFKGVGIFAFLDFKAKALGKTKISLDFEKNSTSDSNIIEANSAKDILEKVNTLNLTIQ